MYKNTFKSNPCRISVYLPISTYNLLQHEFLYNGASKSRLVTVALNEFFDKRGITSNSVKGAEHKARP